MGLSSKSKLFVYASFGIFCLFIIQCKQESKTEKDASSCVKTKPLNPNGDSELAVLMRNMYDSLAAVNTLIKNGGVPTKFPEAFLKLHTAKPTDVNTKPDSFDAFADDYLNTLKSLYHSPKEDLNKNYNSLVQKCANCHQVSCPGPLKKIFKLRLDS